MFLKWSPMPVLMVGRSVTVTDMEPKNVHEIVEAWLKENGYTGLCTEGCGCVAGDLFPCEGGLSYNCCPGYAGKSGTVYETEAGAKKDKGVEG